jgi:hypothetical protein
MTMSAELDLDYGLIHFPPSPRADTALRDDPAGSPEAPLWLAAKEAKKRMRRR